GDVDAMADAEGLDLDPSLSSIGDEGSSPDALEGVAELAAGRADVMEVAGDAARVVEGPLDHVGGGARTGVLDFEDVVRKLDVDHRRDASGLARIEGVVDHLLQQRSRPAGRRMADLHGQLIGLKELHQATGGEGFSRQLGGLAHYSPLRGKITPHPADR